MRQLVLIIFLLCAALIGCDRKEHASAASKPLTVFAAASTTDVLQEIGKRFEAQSGVKVTFSFDSSSNLTRQIKAGAPADIFISADQQWMDDVAAAGEIRSETRTDLLANELVMITPADKPFEVKATKEFDFSASLPLVKRIAVGDPTHVPAGMYAKQSLEWLGWWGSLKDLLLPAQDVRAALRLVETGEADAGIVYSTDAQRSDKVIVVARFPSESHDPIRYPIALCKNASAGAADFVRFLGSGEAETIFEKAGFGVLRESTTNPRAGANR